MWTLIQSDTLMLLIGAILGKFETCYTWRYRVLYRKKKEFLTEVSNVWSGIDVHMSPLSFPQCTIEMIVLIVWSDCSGWMCCRGADGTRPRHRRGWRPTKARWDSAQWTIWGAFFLFCMSLFHVTSCAPKFPLVVPWQNFPWTISTNFIISPICILPADS